MIELNSNGIKPPGQEWCGTDPVEILYPSVSSCITVTCVVEEGLAGLHLAAMLYAEMTDKDITAYGEIVKNPTAMYVVGMLSRRWAADSQRNFTGLTYGSSSGGTLIARLREATQFAGVVFVCDTSGLGEELDITATRSLAGVEFAYVGPDGSKQTLTTFERVAGSVPFAPQKKSGGCIIL